MREIWPSEVSENFRIENSSKFEFKPRSGPSRLGSSLGRRPSRTQVDWGVDWGVDWAVDPPDQVDWAVDLGVDLVPEPTFGPGCILVFLVSFSVQIRLPKSYIIPLIPIP